MSTQDTMNSKTSTKNKIVLELGHGLPWIGLLTATLYGVVILTGIFQIIMLFLFIATAVGGLWRALEYHFNKLRTDTLIEFGTSMNLLMKQSIKTTEFLELTHARLEDISDNLLYKGTGHEVVDNIPFEKYYLAIDTMDQDALNILFNNLANIYGTYIGQQTRDDEIYAMKIDILDDLLQRVDSKLDKK